MFFCLDSSTGGLQGSKHYTDSVTETEYGYNKMTEHNNVIYIFFLKSGSRITAFDMNTTSFTSSVEISGKLIRGGVCIVFNIDEVWCL
jgi:hypothetical protein